MKKERGKTIEIDKDIHTILQIFCKANKISMRMYLEDLIKRSIRNKLGVNEFNKLYYEKICKRISIDDIYDQLK